MNEHRVVPNVGRPRMVDCTPQGAIRVQRIPCLPGESVFSPEELLVAAWFGTPRAVEQLSDGRLWRGSIEPGDMHVLAPREQRTFRKTHAGEYVCLFIDAAFIEERLPSLGGVPAAPRSYAALRDAALRHLIEAVAAESAAGPPSHLFREAAAEAVVARLLSLDGAANRPLLQRLPPAALKRVTELLHADPARELSIDDLAGIAGLSPAHFATLFRNSTGEPPHRFQVRLRVEHARRLLERGVAPADAALAVGFCDQSHLARHMRRLLGVTPGAIARAHRPRKTTLPIASGAGEGGPGRS